MTESITGIYRILPDTPTDRPPLVLIVDDEATIRLLTRH